MVTDGADVATEEETMDDEVYYRFSAYENDRRITDDKRLLPGTYATTKRMEAR